MHATSDSASKPKRGFLHPPRWLEASNGTSRFGLSGMAVLA
jgi:hypothetical protein